MAAISCRAQEIEAPNLQEALELIRSNPHALDFLEKDLSRFSPFSCCESIGSGSGIPGANFPGVYKVGGPVSPPQAVSAPDPEYSSEALRKHVEGMVLLRVVVGANGRVSDIRVAHSLGSGLDEKAIEAVKQWRFKPAKKNDTPVPVEVNIELNFKFPH